VKKMALTDTFIKQTKEVGKHFDGGGMYLHVKPAGKYWRMDYRFAGKAKTLALGTYPEVSLLKARQRREKARELLADGIDPSAAKKQEKAARLSASTNTFERVAREWLEKTQAGNKATTHNKKSNWLEKDVYPYIGSMPMSAVGPRDVLGALRHMETRGALDSVHRLKQVCGEVFRYAVAAGYVERDVTQDLKGALARPQAGHHAAITDPKQFGALLRSIADYQGHPCTLAALKLSPLVFVRPGELRTAEWVEIDLSAGAWNIPASKMKMKREHLVPLSSQALAILKELHAITGHGKYVFPSLRTGEAPMSENTINAALRGMGYAKETHSGHGFRASARTIMDEVLGELVDLIEHQLAHEVRDANGRAYNRTAHLPARKEMMQRWADYLDKLRVGADVIQFKAAS
jgi:integrase